MVLPLFFLSGWYWIVSICHGSFNCCQRKSTGMERGPPWSATLVEKKKHDNNLIHYSVTNCIFMHLAEVSFSMCHNFLDAVGVDLKRCDYSYILISGTNI